MGWRQSGFEAGVDEKRRIPNRRHARLQMHGIDASLSRLDRNRFHFQRFDLSQRFW